MKRTTKTAPRAPNQQPQPFGVYAVPRDCQLLQSFESADDADVYADAFNVLNRRSPTASLAVVVIDGKALLKQQASNRKALKDGAT